MMRPIPAVVIGSGNVASCVVPALQKAGVIDTKAVYSPTPGHAEALAARLGEARGVCRNEDIPTEGVKLYLLAVKDDAVAELARTLKPAPDAVWLHTSGGVEASTLAPLTEHFGVFYPLQTFSKGVEVDLSKVPVFVEGADEFALTTARPLAKSTEPTAPRVAACMPPPCLPATSPTTSGPWPTTYCAARPAPTLRCSPRCLRRQCARLSSCGRPTDRPVRHAAAIPV